MKKDLREWRKNRARRAVKAFWNNFRDVFIPDFELPDFPKKHTRLSDLDLHFHYPFDPELIETMTGMMEEDGWKLGFKNDMKDNWGSHFRTFEKTFKFKFPRYSMDGKFTRTPKIEVDLWWDTDHKESTCKRTKIGERVVTEEVYEISCKEGNKETTWRTSERRKL